MCTATDKLTLGSLTYPYLLIVLSHENQLSKATHIPDPTPAANSPCYLTLLITRSFAFVFPRARSYMLLVHSDGTADNASEACLWGGKAADTRKIAELRVCT
jgi:hypothetical protein